MLLSFPSYQKFFNNKWPSTLYKGLPQSGVSNLISSVTISSVQLLSPVLRCVQLLATPWITAHQASLSITNSRSSPKLTSIESVMPSSNLILCRPLFLLPPIPPSDAGKASESFPMSQLFAWGGCYYIHTLNSTLSSVQFSRSAVCNSLQPHGQQHGRLPCPSPTPRACSNSCPWSLWCHPTILSSVVPSPPAFNLSQHQGLS